MAGRFKLYLCVRKQDGARGPLWRLWTQGNELYAAFRAMGGQQKFSFHSQLNGRREARYALTSEHAKEIGLPASERVMDTFDRPSAQPEGSNTFVPVLKVYCPAGSLSRDMDAIDPSLPVHWLSDAPPNFARIFEINFTNETEETIRQSSEFATVEVISYHRLSNGEAFFVASRLRRYEFEDTLHESISGPDLTTVYTKRTIIGFKRECSLAVVNVHFGFNCFQASGYALPTDFANTIFPNAKRFRRDKVLSKGDFSKTL